MNKVLEQEKNWLLEEKYKGQKCEAFLADLKKLENGEPLAFLIGHQPFLNCHIDLSFRPLIPRSETEFWVNDFIENELKKRNLAEPNFAPKILDIFSGSGCIGIAILKNFPQAKVDFTEINPLFIKQIKKNIKINFGTYQVRPKIYQSDLFKNLPEKKWDYILANPPYIPENKKIPESVLNFEDHSSLFAPENGLYFVKKTILDGLKRLENNGKIFIEFDENSKKEIEKFLTENKIKNYIFKKDQFKNDRLLIIQKIE